MIGLDHARLKWRDHKDRRPGKPIHLGEPLPDREARAEAARSRVVWKPEQAAHKRPPTITPATAAKIDQLLAEGLSVRKVASLCGVSQVTVEGRAA